MNQSVHAQSWTIRTMLPSDAAAALEMRSRTRENAVSAHDLEHVYGVTVAAVSAALQNTQVGWVCTDQDRVVGFAIGDTATGEVVVVAMLPNYEGLGIGRRLLTLVTDRLIEAGHRRLFLFANPDPRVRASGFYHRLGWIVTDQRNGPDIRLERQIDDADTR